uniref:Tectorin alpha n=1 Tax=Latimeria chalumnae TaxID=7897 RepID=H3A4Z5_LATCH
SVSVAFRFFDTSYTSLYVVNNNGVVSFGVSVSQFTPDAFPLGDGRAFVAPFWGDVHNGITGNVFYRQSTDSQLLQRATRDINQYFPNLNFTATWMFVATWDRVAYYGSTSSKVNTFQAVLITNGNYAFIILNYGDIEWTTGTASGGDAATGLGGTPAQAGFNSGNSSYYFSIPGSRTADIINIKSTSNVNNPGRWVFRSDNFSVIGGCMFDGKYVRIGDTFWTPNTCQTKCKCVDTSELICENQPCGDGEVCEPSFWYHVCKSVSTSTCSVSGDPHYYTFDGRLFHFQGTCTYILSEPCRDHRNLTYYRVEAKNENRGNLQVSWTRLVRVIAYNKEITMVRGRQDEVLVNGIMSSVPVSLLGGQIRIYKSGFSITVSAGFGLVVTYDNSHYVTISLPLTYFNSTCGLCGTLNNDQSDDFLTSRGTIATSETEFAKSWKVVDNDTVCRDECDSLCLECNEAKRALYSGSDYCGLMKNTSGIFSRCTHMLPPDSFIDSCVYDLCASNGFQTMLCQALNAYAARCQQEGAPPAQWRRPGLCEIPCPENSHYEQCATACPASCADTTAPLFCNQPCRESCVCDPGYILSGGACIPQTQCGCTLDGHYYNIGESVILNEACSRKCTCRNAVSMMDCQDHACSIYEECKVVNGVRGCYSKQYGTCWASGDPHYRTFDGLPFDFQGTCKYTLSKYCGPQGNHTGFSVEVENEHRGSTIVSWTRWVQLDVYGHQISVASGEYNTVVVDGSRYNLPVSFESGKIRIHRSGSSAVVQTDFGITVSYDWYHLVTLRVPGTYQGLLCGLCGNFNGDTQDEFTTPNNTLVNNAVAFGNSWLEESSSASLCSDLGNTPVCTEGRKTLYRSQSYCGVITQTSGPFAGCHGSLDPTLYLENCVFDLCAMNGDHETLCQAVKNYALQCQRHGAVLQDWRNRTRCELNCGANSHYEVCGSSCPLTCSSFAFPFDCNTPCEEGCQCDTGCVLSGGDCVPLAHCGCVYRGRYYRPGEAFWVGENCQTRCQCNGTTGSVQCSSGSCAPDDSCSMLNGVYGCHRIPDGTCWAVGDPHYTTFDGFRYDFQGNCTYVLAEVCNASEAWNYFSIRVKNRNWAGLPVSVTAAVSILVYGSEIHFQQGTVTVNGLSVNLPLVLNGGNISIHQSGIYTTLTTGFGLTVRYDMIHALSVTLSSRYRGKICGLCGNFNGVGSDDLRNRSGALADNPYQFAVDWKSDSDAVCNHGCADCEDSLPTCEDRTLFQSNSHCGLITDNRGPLALCHLHFDPAPFFSNCVFDTCLSSGDLSILCQSVQTYVGACQAANVTIENWRNQTFCAMLCPANSHYETCGDKCRNLCASSSVRPFCDSSCSEGCYCDDGYLQSGNGCVLVAQCGCVHEGLYYNVSLLLHTEKQAEAVQCHSNNELKRSAFLCSHRNKRKVMEHTIGIYRDRLNIPPLEPQAETLQGMGHTVEIYRERLSIPPLGQQMETLSEVEHGNIQYRERLKMSILNAGRRGITEKARLGLHNGFSKRKSSKIMINGSIVSLPANVGSVATVTQVNKFVVVQTGHNVEIHFDGSNTLMVRVGQQYRNRLCGMCGNFNADPNDDKVLPNGNRATDDLQFGNSWKSRLSKPGEGYILERERWGRGIGECQDATDGGELECNIERNKEYCGIIINRDGPFSECHGVIDPDPFFLSCMYDLCQYGMENRILCAAIGSYEDVCNVHGVQSQPWQNSVGCPLVNPCDAQNCTEEEWCGEQRGTVGCYCYQTFENETRRTYDHKLNCSGSESSVSLSRCLLFADGFPTNVLHLNDPNCAGSVLDGRVVFSFDTVRRTCGMRLKVSATHFIYSNAIQETPGVELDGVITRHKSVSLTFTCTYPLTMNLSLPLSINPVESVVDTELPSGQGTYQTKMILYRDEGFSRPFTENPVQLQLDEKVFIGLSVSGVDPNQFALTLSSCWATPDSSPFSATSWDLIINQCPGINDGTVKIYEDGVSTIARFSFGVFKFVTDSDQVYVHCQIRLCDRRMATCTVVITSLFIKMCTQKIVYY